MTKLICFCLLVVFNITPLYSQTNSVQLTPPIGSPTLCESILEAYSLIPSGLTGNYIIELLPGFDGTNEAYPISLTDKIPGSFTITLRPAAGNTGEVIQRTVPAPGSVLRINGGDNIIIDGRPGGITTSPSDYLTFNDPFAGNNTNRNIDIINGSDNNIIQYVNLVSALPVGASGGRNVSIGATNATGNTGNIIRNSVITGGLRGIQDAGQPGTPNSGTQILFNDITEFGNIGIFASQDQNNITIENNTIHLVSFVPSASTLYGISVLGGGTANVNQNQIYNLTGSAATLVEAINTATFVPVTLNISRNQIYNLSSSAAARIRGMYLIFLTGSAVNINNNFVSITETNSTATQVTGIFLALESSNTYTAVLYYNSVRIGGVHTGGFFSDHLSAGICSIFNIAGSSFTSKNNICINDRTGSSGGLNNVGFSIENLGGTFDVDYNVYYGTNGAINNAYAASWSSLVYDNTQLANYQLTAAPNEQNSRFVEVNFVSNTDLHLTGLSIGGGDLAGITVPITFDIDGFTRADPPYIGADENATLVPVEMISFTSSINLRNVTLNWATNSEHNNAMFEIERKVSGADTWAKVGEVAGKGNTNTVVYYIFTDNNLSTGKYYYRLKQIDFNGNYEYHALANEVVVGAPFQFNLSQNYPNPFNPSTKINYDLPFDSRVSIKIYDLTGREITSLVNQVLTAGYHTVNFNAANLASGVYFYMINANGGNQSYVKTMKMVLVK